MPPKSNIEAHIDIHTIQTHPLSANVPSYTLTDDFLWHRGDVRECELNLRKKRNPHKHTHRHTPLAHVTTRPINRMTLAPLNLNYIAGMVASISIRPSIILSSIVPRQPLSIFNSLSFNLLTSSPILSLDSLSSFSNRVHVFFQHVLCFVCIHKSSNRYLSREKTRI